MATAEPGQTTGRLRADKRLAIMAGGREVFARDGYERASIDGIAAAASVSTRTIYKHFADKSALFAAVVADSATQVADEEIALIQRHLGGVATVEQVEPALIGFATAWVAGSAPSAAHRALVGQVHAEAAHLGAEIVTTWWAAGPGRVMAELGATFARWSAAGLLDIADPERAAVHFSELVAARPGPPTAAFPARQRRSWIVDGVGIFVRAHRPAVG